MSIPETDKMLAALFDVAEDYEADVLSDLLLRAGLTWKCEAPRRELGDECLYRNPADASACLDCQAPRPTAEEVCAGCEEPIYEDGIGNWCHASDGARFCSRPAEDEEDPEDGARPAATWHIEADDPPTYAGDYCSPREAAEQASRYTFPVRIVRVPT